MSTLEVYLAFDVAWADIQRMQGIRAWRRWLNPKFYTKRCRQFDTFWFELRRRMRLYDEGRGPLASRTLKYFERDDADLTDV